MDIDIDIRFRWTYLEVPVDIDIDIRFRWTYLGTNGHRHRY